MNARQSMQRRDRFASFDPEDPSVVHGRHSSYIKGCRCQRCKSAYSDYRKKTVYGMNPGQYRKAVESRDGTCDICKSSDKELKVDHDHNTGAVRGLLCNNCNTALGKFKDSTEILLSAINYLSSPPGVDVE